MASSLAVHLCIGRPHRPLEDFLKLSGPFGPFASNDRTVRRAVT